MAFHPVYATALYRSTKKKVLASPIKDKWPEIGKELVVLYDKKLPGATFSEKVLSFGFVWGESPQGHNFWITIARAIDPNHW